MRKLLLMASVLTLSFGACKKDKTETNKDRLTKHSWRYQSAWMNGIPQNLPGCSVDNRLTFSSSNTGTFDEGATKCDPQDLQTVPFTWTITDDHKTVTLSTSAGTVIYRNVVVTDEKLEVEVADGATGYKFLYLKN